MCNFNNIAYDLVRIWIRTKSERGRTWEEIRLGCKNSQEELREFLVSQEEDNDWPQMSVEQFQALVSEMERRERERIEIKERNESAVVAANDQINDIGISQWPESAWQMYKRYLLERKHFANVTVDLMEESALNLLSHMSTNTQNTGPFKGLVIGNVQSGKTANMGAVMAMAADCGWNMFIVLSGTIENLRLQTVNRLLSDLNRPGCNLQWEALDSRILRPGLGQGFRAQDKHFNADSCSRYLTCCLKNATRIKNLIKWLQEDPHTAQQMKILVIDDEADQAGINTQASKGTWTKISGLMKNLVNGKTWNGESTEAQFQAMNYVGYTATPYANILNDARPESLYPRDYITTLAPSKEYFGPQQIFGCADTTYDGMDIVRTIIPDDIQFMADIHRGTEFGIPNSLKDAIRWFICGSACMRYFGMRQPISMLVHTSQRTPHHENVANAIETWIRTQQLEAMIDNCRRLWEEETTRFSKEVFHQQYNDYSNFETIRDYPTFDEIEEEIRNILNLDQRVSHIELKADDVNGTPYLAYQRGIHLCVDNSVNNGISDENEIIRLIYPDNPDQLDFSPLFIVVGGATLSRGLTIEGLISTYFLRSVSASDTLMQMGRWFGYRRGYELIPRLWITNRVMTQMSFLAELDKSLRGEIHEMEIKGIRPCDCGPRIKNSVSKSLIRITAANRMQAAIPADMNYQSLDSQTTYFVNDEEVLRQNLELASTFFERLGHSTNFNREQNPSVRHSLLWENVSFDNIRPFLENYHYHANQRVFQHRDQLIQWIAETTQLGHLSNWNVWLVGIGDENAQQWETANHETIRMVSRTKVESLSNDDTICIKTLRGPSDKRLYREYAGAERIDANPLLLVYIIDRDSRPQRNSRDRVALDSPEHIVGFNIMIPGDLQGSDYTENLTIRLPEGLDDNDVDDADFAEETVNNA